MFETVNFKFERAEYFLEKIRNESIGTQPWRACLEAFFFELISAKDFFLQKINDEYEAGLKRLKATYTGLLKKQLTDPKALDAVDTIEKTLKNEKSPVGKIKNYRNSATHRELLPIEYVASTDLDHVEAHLLEDPEDDTKGNMKLEVIPYCEQSLRAMRDFLEQLYSQLS